MTLPSNIHIQSRAVESGFEDSGTEMEFRCLSPPLNLHTPQLLRKKHIFHSMRSPIYTSNQIRWQLWRKTYGRIRRIQDRSNESNR